MKFLTLALLIFSGFVTTFTVIGQDTNNTTATQAQATYAKGVHYTELEPAFATDNAEQVVVYEFFGYKCGACANFEPFMSPWHKKLPKHIKLVKIPLILQPGWDIFAKGYYTAETMGIAEKSHAAVFDAIHKKRKKFSSIEDIAGWYADNFGVDKEAFLSTANSFMIDSKIRQSNNMMRKMGITSTPSLVINGKYKPNVRALGNHSAILDLTTYLANQEAVKMGIIK